jgi:hypothetical protein
MRRANSMVLWCATIGFACAVVARAQEAPKEGSPPAAAAKVATSPAQAAPAGQAPAKAEPAQAQPATSKPAAVDEATKAAIAEWAKKLRARAQGEGPYLTVGDICQVKQYKQEALQGFGMVLDLEAALAEEKSAVGEETAPAAGEARLAELLELLNTPVAPGAAPAVPESLRGAGVLNLAAVTATIPPEGVRKGDRIDCEVRPLGGKSAGDGYLLTTQLYPPGPKTETPAGLAAGPIIRESAYRSGPAKVAGGCLIQTDLCDQFVQDGKITLVLDEEHATYPIAQDVVNLINGEMGVAMNQPLAKAPNRYNVDVTVPLAFTDDPVAFVTLILRLQTQIPAPEEKTEKRTFGGTTRETR